MNAFRLCENKILGAGSYKLACRGLCLLLLIVAVACGRQAPPPPPSEPLEPPKPAMVEHTVQYSGETLGLIARWYTGKTSNWQEIVAANPGLRPERINIGDQIMIPASLVVNDKPLPSTAVRRGNATRSTSRATSGATAETTTAVVGDSAVIAEEADDSPVGDVPAIDEPVLDEAIVEAPDEDLSVDALLGEIAAEREQSEKAVEDSMPSIEQDAAEVLKEVSPEPVADAPTSDEVASEAVVSDEDELERERLLDELLSQ